MATAPANERSITADELLLIPDEPDGTTYELVRGRLLSVSPASPRSNEIAAELIRLVGNHVRAEKLGRFGGSEGGFRLASLPDTVRAPDVWFIRADRVSSGHMPRKYFEGAPDLVVEVLSPTDRIGDIWQRVGQYQEAGALLIWVLDPDTEAAVAFCPGRMPEIIGRDGVLVGGDVLPGFRVSLREVFEA